MSALKKFLSKLEEMGPAYGQFYGRGTSKLGLEGLGSDIVGGAMRHPKTAAVLGGGILPGAAGAALGKGAEEADEALPEEAGHPAEGALLGAGMGSMANLGKVLGGGKSSLAKYLAIGGLLGGGAGLLSRDHKEDDL